MKKAHEKGTCKMLLKKRPGLNFINIPCTALTHALKDTDDLTVLLGSTSVKAEL